MADPEHFQAVFAQLKAILQPFAARLIVETDKSNQYALNTPYVAQYKKPLFFGAAQINKNYVSYHLMPVYMFPALLDGISPDLKQRMQGKSCFNFTVIDRELFAELARLTACGFERFEREQLLSASQ